MLKNTFLLNTIKNYSKFLSNTFIATQNSAKTEKIENIQMYIVYMQKIYILL